MKNLSLLFLVSFAFWAVACADTDSNVSAESRNLFWLEEKVRSQSEEKQREWVRELFSEEEGRMLLHLAFSDTFSETVSVETKSMILDVIGSSPMTDSEIVNVSSIAGGDGNEKIREKAFNLLDSRKSLIADPELSNRIRSILLNTLENESSQVLKSKKAKFLKNI